MLIAIDRNGNEVDAKDAKRNEKYFCPVCNSEVQLKRGDIKKEHFSHVSIHMCERHLYRKESEMHLMLKHELYFKFGEAFNVKMECYLENIQQIPDLLVEDNHAVEIQLSKVSPSIILNSTRGYEKEGIDVTWLIKAVEIHNNDNNTKEYKKEGIDITLLLKEEDLNIKAHTIQLTQFHYAVMKDFIIYTVNNDLEISRYILTDNLRNNQWLFKIERIHYTDIFNHYCPLFFAKLRSRNDILKEIKSEREKRSYLNKTIGYLYQLSLSEDNLPKILYYSTPSERFINNNSLEWKLYLYHAVKTNSYNYDEFLKLLSVRKMNHMTNHYVAKGLLKDFKQ